MSFSIFTAKRYIKSKHGSKFLSFISYITIGGIALGVTVLIISLTILNGFEKAVSDKIIKFNSHLTITGFGNRNLPDYREILPNIEKRLNNYEPKISPFISKLAILKAKNVSEGVTINGILPSLDNTQIKEFIIKGKYDLSESGSLQNLLIGEKLANKLFVNLGDKVTLFSLKKDEMPSYENPPAIQQFRVTGIYRSGMAEYDDLNVYVNLNVAQEMLAAGNEISGYNIRLNSISKLDSLKNDLQDYLGYPYYVRTVFNVHQNIFTWLDLQKEPIPIVLGLIIIVAVFNIVGTLLMIVLERTSDIGTLKSMGANRKQIIKIFIYQGIYLSLIGILIGNTLAFILSFLQKNYNLISLPDTVYFISSVPISIEWQIYIMISIIAFVLCLLSSFIPSYIASKIRPISAIKFD